MTEQPSSGPTTAAQFHERIGRQLGFALKDPNPNIRFLALEALQQLRIFPPDGNLVALLKDVDRFVRWKAIQTAGVLQRAEAREVLRIGLGAADLNTRAFAAASLGQIGDAADLPLMREAFGRDLAPRVRQALVRAMTGFADIAVLDLLAVSSRDGDLGVRLDTAEVLGLVGTRFPGTAACDILVNMLERENHTRVFASAILSLGRFKREPLIDYFCHSLLHQESRIRANAIEALGLFGFEKVKHIVLPYVSDPANRVRANVISIFYRAGQGRDMAAHVVKLLDSSSRWDRASGAWLAGTFRLAEHMYRLIDLLGDEEPVVAERTAWALGRLKSPGVFAAIAKAYPEASTWSLAHLINSMKETASGSDVPTIMHLLARETDQQYKALFIEVLTHLQAESVAGQILPLTDAPDHRVRAAALRYFGTLAPLRHADLLLAKIADPNTRIRSMCAQILFAAGDFRAIRYLSEMLNDQVKLERVQSVQSLREFAAMARQIETARQSAPRSTNETVESR